MIITSNKEKGNLPPPFLRRCIYYFIRFPQDPDALKEIIDLHMKEALGKALQEETGLIDKAVALFLKIRRSGMTKPPSTSELLDWMRVLLNFQGKAYAQAEFPEEVTAELPYRELLYKLRDDWKELPEAR